MVITLNFGSGWGMVGGRYGGIYMMGTGSGIGEKAMRVGKGIGGGMSGAVGVCVSLGAVSGSSSLDVESK